MKSLPEKLFLIGDDGLEYECELPKLEENHIFKYFGYITKEGKNGN